MASATLAKTRRKASNGTPRSIGLPDNDADDSLKDDLSIAFYMPSGSMTLDEFRQWTYSDHFPTTGVITYLGEEIFIDMSPERIISHGSVKVAVCAVLANLVRKKKLGRFFIDRTRFTHSAAKVSNEPDALFATWETLRTERLRRIPTAEGDDDIEFEGSPDWIMEIVSPSSVTKDNKKLRKRYHKAGVNEYWLIDARRGQVDFQILAHAEKEYEPAARQGQWQVSKVFGKKFRLRRITDELGDIDYRLDVK